MSKSFETLESIENRWKTLWHRAMDLWSPYTRLREPVFCRNNKDEKKESLTGSFAMIRLTDLSVVLSLKQIHQMKLESFALEIMAHEVGHHIYCPADLPGSGRMLARIRKALPGFENMAPMVSNLYSDLLINHKLFTEFNLKIDKIYEKLRGGEDDLLWNFYMRIYEILWALPGGTLTAGEISGEMEGDAVLGNQVIRHYAGDWLKGAGRFGALCFTYILKQQDKPVAPQITLLMDALSPGDCNSFPAGLTGMDPGELNEVVHPAMENEEDAEKEETEPQALSNNNDGGENYRQPFEYGEILKGLGIHLSRNELAIRYYRERAIPYLLPFPRQITAQKTDPLPEGLEIWEFGSPIEKINWLESVIRSPVVIPGMTTVEQTYGTSAGSEPETEPVDLDIYVDCSGSMPDPAANISYPALAGTIIALSALRTGSRVQATLWSGKKQFIVTGGFLRDEIKILEIITGYLGGGTAFPIHILRETYKNRKTKKRKVHILVISDDGVTTMFNRDEQNNDGHTIAATALEKAGGGGTFVLNLYGSWKKDKELVGAAEMGWDIYPIKSWQGLIEFSKDFVAKNYKQEQTK